MKPPRRCPHCGSSAKHVACEKCTREMCEDCISVHGDVGKVCGLCYDRIVAHEKWRNYRAEGGKMDFDEWYDQNG